MVGLTTREFDHSFSHSFFRLGLVIPSIREDGSDIVKVRVYVVTDVSAFFLSLILRERDLYKHPLAKKRNNVTPRHYVAANQDPRDLDQKERKHHVYFHQ